MSRHALVLIGIFLVPSLGWTPAARADERGAEGEGAVAAGGAPISTPCQRFEMQSPPPGSVATLTVLVIGARGERCDGRPFCCCVP